MTISDEWTLEDYIGHAPHISSLGEMVKECTPPYVIGIHGDWGSGKTSFLRKLHLYLSGKKCGYKGAENATGILWSNNYHPATNIEAIWFDAWRYQFEPTPAVALLNEIRSHFTLYKKFVGESAKLTYSALMSIDELTKKIGISPEKIINAGEKWEKDYLSRPLPSQLCKDLLEQAIKDLLGRGKNRRLVIFVDDLDRCVGKVAFRLLEAMKIYFSITNCVFILGMDVRHVKGAVACELKETGSVPGMKDGSEELYAGDYLNKIFQHVFYLPYTASYKKYLGKLFKTQEKDLNQEYIDKIIEYDLLPRNPRKVKTFINGLQFYLKQLKEKSPKEAIVPEYALIFAYLKYMSHDIYRILESDMDFWNPLVSFCQNGRAEDIEVFKPYKLREKVTQIETENMEFQYESAFLDPGDESVFHVAGLIRNYNNGIRPTDDELNRYLLRV